MADESDALAVQPYCAGLGRARRRRGASVRRLRRSTLPFLGRVGRPLCWRSPGPGRSLGLRPPEFHWGYRACALPTWHRDRKGSQASRATSPVPAQAAERRAWIRNQTRRATSWALIPQRRWNRPAVAVGRAQRGAYLGRRANLCSLVTATGPKPSAQRWCAVLPPSRLPVRPPNRGGITVDPPGFGTEALVPGLPGRLLSAKFGSANAHDQAIALEQGPEATGKLDGRSRFT